MTHSKSLNRLTCNSPGDRIMPSPSLNTCIAIAARYLIAMNAAQVRESARGHTHALCNAFTFAEDRDKQKTK